MKNTIVFCITVNMDTDYGLIAGFLYKREYRLELTKEELLPVTFRYYLNNSNTENRTWANVIAADKDQFASVQQPEKIKNITEKYEVLYCLQIANDVDIADLHHLYLLSRYYSALNILILFREYDEDHFFQISQFLYHVNITDRKFYDSCFFVTGKDIKSCQMKQIRFSKRFLPLQIVDSDNLKRLFQENAELLDQEYLYKVFTEDDLHGLEKKSELLDGAVRLLRDFRKELAVVPEEHFVRVLRGMDVLSLVLFCYTISTKKNNFSLNVLEEHAYKMQQYASAIRQLAENIVFHSITGIGVLVLRIHHDDPEYMEKMYRLPRAEGRQDYLEVIVRDFCGDDKGENIAENFIKNIENEALKQEFLGLLPDAFFTHEKGAKEQAWKHFYRDPEHIGRHFGLKIFQSVVNESEGYFGAESHSGYQNQPGDSFLSYPGSQHKNCMPGTSYHIVFPIKPVQSVIARQDLSLDSGIAIGGNMKQVFAYRAEDLDIPELTVQYPSQELKNRQIAYFANLLQGLLSGKKCDAVYISLEKYQERAGEVLAKALLIALFHLTRNMRVVLFQCTSHLKKTIFDTLKAFFQNSGLEGMFYGRTCQVILYSDDFEETVIDLSSADRTDCINAYIAHMKCILQDQFILDKNGGNIDFGRGSELYIPCDILHEVEIDGKKQTLFEHYAERILKRNIQDLEFGCKFEHTHMRLGSTIHIDNFYEAEILFGNKLFVSRFALLLVKDMLEAVRDVDKLTLYGYGTYSETVLVQIMDMIQNFYPQKKEIDYIVLEREEEQRGFLHKDRIRYNRPFQSKEEREEYFKDRKIVIIVLINSTLKTHARLISLFKDENLIGDRPESEWLIRNYAVLLIGNGQENQYWGLSKDKKEIELSGSVISPAPKYLIHLQADYQEPTDCEYCFPKNPVAEIPLVEVNAASTIPNQAYGIIRDSVDERLKLDYEWIADEEDKLKCLSGRFVYGHVQRNENHFLYYFKTEDIWLQEKDKIRESLRTWSEQHIQQGKVQYNIIVAPMHFSNAGFVELVNYVVFQGNAILLRIDFDKEYRCNAYAKFSYLRNYVKQFRARNVEGTIRVHYVDDIIISGRTYHRAKSLIESVLEYDREQGESVEIRIFDKIFVLIDRNSKASSLQYVSCYETDFYAFLHINISSLRNFGDSCVLCNLKKEADLLFETSSTAPIAEYWEHCAEKFQLYSLEEYEALPEIRKPKSDRAFRRLFCTHMAQSVLCEQYHGNKKEKAAFLILKLLNTDYENRAEQKYEYFLSYLKCISRPFVVFRRAVKEAVFDILLILIDALVNGKKIRSVIKKVESKKPYLNDRALIMQFNRLDKNVLQDSELSFSNRQDLVKLIMKQLTELKSNYIIRPDRMDAIFQYMKEEEPKDFYIYYLTLIDRLIGASSDTNKSIWLDRQIRKSHVPECFQAWIILENTRAFRDGIEKFYIKRSQSKQFRDLADKRISDLRSLYDYRRAEKMFQNYIKQNKTQLDSWIDATEDGGEESCRMMSQIRRFIKSLPELKEINFIGCAESLEESDTNWSRILYEEQRILQKEHACVQKDIEREKVKKGLQELIRREPDIYQYSNFYRLLQVDGYIGEDGLTEDGIDMIVCCTKVLELCRKADKGILEKVQELAVLLRIILDAEKIQFIVENKEENSLNEWKEEIEKEYNSLVQDWNKNNNDHLESIQIRVKKRYTIIMEKSGAEDYSTELSEEAEQLLECMDSENGKLHNYLIDKKSGSVLWELRSQERCIWIYIKKDEWRSDKGDRQVKIARDMRRVMVFYQELKQKVFNSDNDDFINEISHVRRELSIYNSNKVYSHAKDYPQKMQFEQTLNFFCSDSDKRKYIDVYPSYVLNLLADINVSKYYRSGLQKKLYYEIPIREPAKWKELSTLLRSGQQFVFQSGDNEKVDVKLEVTGIEETDEVICRGNNQDSIRELTLLIYALVLNAAEKGRGKRGENKNNAVPTGSRCVIVELSREEDFLVIRNECEQPVRIDKIRAALHKVPESEADGISLWSFNCYIKRRINSLITEKLKETEFDKEQLVLLKAWIERLMGEACEIRPESEVIDGKHYFKVMVPIFMDKYRLE